MPLPSSKPVKEKRPKSKTSLRKLLSAGRCEKTVPLAAATGSHQIDSLCKGKRPRPSLGKRGCARLVRFLNGKKFIEEFLGLFPLEQMHREDSYSTLATVLSSHELEWGKSDPCEAPLMTKKGLVARIGAHEGDVCFVTASSTTAVCSKLAGKLLPTKQPSRSWLASSMKDEPQHQLFRVRFGKDDATLISFGTVVLHSWGQAPAHFSQLKSESLAGLHSARPKPAKQQKQRRVLRDPCTRNPAPKDRSGLSH